MKYDFTSIMDRRGKDAIAIDGLGAMPGFAPDAPQDGLDAIPMWVADMNFPTCPPSCRPWRCLKNTTSRPSRTRSGPASS